MIDVAPKTDILNHYYRTYCEKIDIFCSTHNLGNKDYAPYAILYKYWQPYVWENARDILIERINNIIGI